MIKFKIGDLVSPSCNPSYTIYTVHEVSNLGYTLSFYVNINGYKVLMVCCKDYNKEEGFLVYYVIIAAIRVTPLWNKSSIL